MRAASGVDQFDGFVHVADGQLLDGHGAPLVLRGVGLGNWLLREGYMWKFEPGGPLSSRQIEAFVVDLVGEEAGGEFWRSFNERFITEADIERIAGEGFDHVRLPINARVVQSATGDLLEDGFRLIDNCIEWCRTHGLWVVLDLHGAPGGQTGTNIDDSPNGIPELYTSVAYTRLTVDLWRSIAERYAGETVVAAYDLLNEPIPNEYQHLYAQELVALYKMLTAAVREVDDKHTIMYEGSHWSTNWDIFTEVWDANSILQCHKYWSPPDRASVRKYVDRGRELGLPVYMGETGENNPEWLQAAFQLYDDCGMSWNFWPWKKIETLTSPCSVNAPAGWDRVVAYGQGTGAKPSVEEATVIFGELLDAFAPEDCTYRTDVVHAILRRVPLRLAPWAFSFRGRGESYGTVDAKPLGGFRCDDAVSLVCAKLDEAQAPDFSHNGGVARSLENEILVQLTAGDWVAFDVDVPTAGDVRVEISTYDTDEASGSEWMSGAAGVPGTAGAPGAAAATVTVTVGARAETAVRAADGTFSVTVGVSSPGVQIVRVTAVGGPVSLRSLIFSLG